VTRTSFDLVSEPWIPVRWLDGRPDELSLRDVLARSSEIGGLRGELPTTTVAVLRLLLAVLHRGLDPTGRPIDRWARRWRADTLPMDEIDAYLERYHDRFDLLHAERPFLQVADLQTAKGTSGDLLPLIADVPNGAQFFTTRAGRGVARLDYDEAARWVLHCHAYDPSGIKSGALGDPRVKGGKGYPIGTGWVGTIGSVFVEGRTLRETLLLNLVLQRRNGDPVQPSTDSAVWEGDPLASAPQALAPAVHLPKGPAELLTWPSRRIRLAHDGNAVTGALISNGDRLEPRDQFLEAMTAWRRSTAQENKLKSAVPVYMPRQHDPARSVWRGLGTLLPASPTTSAADGQPSLPPLVLQWLFRIQGEDEDLLPANYPLRTRAVGVTYGSNNSVIDEIFDDALMVNVVLLGEAGQSLRNTAINAVSAADETATAVAGFAANLQAARGNSDDESLSRARQTARERFFFSVDALYRSWLSTLTAIEDAATALVDWHVELKRAARAQEAQLLDDEGDAAWRGRDVRDRTGKTMRLDTARASLFFEGSLRKALPLAFPAASVPYPPAVQQPTQDVSA
jgi:CRISPR system Cascade subunit CasA